MEQKRKPEILNLKITKFIADTIKYFFDEVDGKISGTFDGEKIQNADLENISDFLRQISVLQIEKIEKILKENKNYFKKKERGSEIYFSFENKNLIFWNENGITFSFYNEKKNLVEKKFYQIVNNEKNLNSVTANLFEKEITTVLMQKNNLYIKIFENNSGKRGKLISTGDKNNSFSINIFKNDQLHDLQNILFFENGKWTKIPIDAEIKKQILKKEKIILGKNFQLIKKGNNCKIEKIGN